MAEFWRTPNFKVLLKTWNSKLKESGFADHELEIKEERVLKQRSTNCYRQADELERESRFEYFSFLGFLANNTEFNNELEKLVMLKHSEGLTIKQIADEIKGILCGVGYESHRKTVRHIIRRWQTKWGVKTWNQKQMNLKK